MKRLMLIEAAAVLVVLAAATALITVTGADLRLSAAFHIGSGWPVGDLPFWQFFYRLNRLPAITMGGAGVALALYAGRNQDWLHWKRGGVFLALLMCLGPGLLVNSVFKEHWGRPRPREVIELGGKKQFQHPWQKGVSGNGRSFPSGHASAAFAMTAPYFVLRRTSRRRALAWLTGGLVFGLLMSAARITQGGHFLSDCLWAWGMVHLTGLALMSLFRLDDAGDGS